MGEPSALACIGNVLLDAIYFHHVNFCGACSSRQEMAQAVGKVQSDVASGALPPDDVSHKHIEQHLYTEVYF